MNQVNGNKEKLFFYLRIILCISLISLWVAWLSILPVSKNQRNKNPEQKEVKEIREHKTETHQPKAVIPKQKTNIKQSKIVFPNPVNLKTIEEISKQEDIKEEEGMGGLEDKKTKTEKISKEISTKVINTQLRGKKLIDKSQLKPLYKKVTKGQTKVPALNLDHIASQLELVGLIKNQDNEAAAAIIKNRTNKKIDILRRGEEFEGLVLLDIKLNEVIFGGENLDKTYTKRIGVGE